MAAGQRRPSASLQGRLLSVLLIRRREVMDGVLDHVAWIHGLLQAAGDALHWRAATCRWEVCAVLKKTTFTSTKHSSV